MSTRDIKLAIEKFNLFQYLRDANIEFSSSADGTEYIAECFHCFRNKLYISASGDKKGLWHCFRCGLSGNLFDLISQVEEIPSKQAFYKVVGQKTFVACGEKVPLPIETPDISVAENMPVNIPINFASLMALPDTHPSVKYALKRGITKDDMANFMLMYSPSDQRLIFPVYFEQQIIGWQGRDITGRSDVDKKYPKALTGPSKRTGCGFKKSNALYGYDRVKNAKFITLVEGPIDCVKGKNVNSVALFGKSMSDAQFKLLLTLKNLRVIFIGLDMDATKERAEVARKLSPFFEVRVVSMPDDKDFGDSTQEEILDYCKNSQVYKNEFRVI